MLIKRLFDISASLVGLLICWPFLLIIALLIKVKMPNVPILFKQKRVGRFGVLFIMIKFRTMSVNHNGNCISIKGENRITPLGSVLRKYKLDELPELWNVLKGDMSFVGPRPDVPGYADKLTGEDRCILELRPGITGPASLKYSNEEELLASQSDPIKYNNEILWPNKVRINRSYMKYQNFWLDTKIIIYTILGRKLDDEWTK